MPIKKLMDKAKEWLGFARSVKAPPEAHARFLLTYDDLLVGTLTVEQGVWRFEYSDKFKSAAELRPIVEFPDVNKIYVNEDLWQFFASRIPSTEQPEVEKILKREHVNEDDAVGLLKLFGKRTIAHPFELNVCCVNFAATSRLKDCQLALGLAFIYDGKQLRLRDKTAKSNTTSIEYRAPLQVHPNAPL